MCGKRAPGVIADLRHTFGPLREAWTEGPGHARTLAREAWDAGTRTFVAVGGDGTAFEIVDGLFSCTDGTPTDEDRPTLGFLPLGTGNSFVRDFDVTDADKAVARLLSGRTRPVDVIRAEHEDGAFHYINLCSLGFSARAGDLTNRRFKRLGAVGYIAAVLVTLARLEHPVFPIRLDAGDWDHRPAALLSFSNSGFTAGTMHMAPDADPADGQLDVIRVGALSRPRFLATFPKIFKGTHTAAPRIEGQRAVTVTLDLPGPVPCMVDGEILEAHLTRLTVQPGALDVRL